MKILHVSNYFKPSFEAGGVVQSVYCISKYLVKNRHDVTVYTTNKCLYDTNVEINKEVIVDNIKVYYFENLRDTFPNIQPIPYYLPLIAKKQIREFDIIHIHEHRSILAIIIHYYAKKHRVPYILQPRGSAPRITKRYQKYIFDILFGKRIVRDAHKVLASSKIESNQYNIFSDLKEENIIHMPNGIDFEEYRNLPEYGCFKKKHCIDLEDKIILFLSRIHKRKGADVLIEAFNLLKDSFGNVKLVIAGPDDGYLKELQELIKKYKLQNDIIFTGSLHGKNKLEAYVDADVFVLPSKDHYESFGNVVLEACACGTPVILTNNCGVSEWINDDVGFIVECDKSQIANSIYKLLSDDALREQYSINAQSLVQKFSWSDITEKLDELYKGCL